MGKALILYGKRGTQMLITKRGWGTQMLITNRGPVQQNVTLELPGLQISLSVKWGH